MKILKGEVSVDRFIKPICIENLKTEYGNIITSMRPITQTISEDNKEVLIKYFDSDGQTKILKLVATGGSKPIVKTGVQILDFNNTQIPVGDYPIVIVGLDLRKYITSGKPLIIEHLNCNGELFIDRMYATVVKKNHSVYYIPIPEGNAVNKLVFNSLENSIKYERG